MVTDGAWDRWFFIRYADPSPHLRLRFHGEPISLVGTLLPLIHRILAPFIKDGLCWKVQVDTYEPELERYGGPLGMELSELWFEIDSLGVLETLEACMGDEGAESRWKSAIGRLDAILVGLGLDLPEKLQVMKRIRAGLGMEFHSQSQLDIHLGKRYRLNAIELEGLVPFPAQRGQLLTNLVLGRERTCFERIRAAIQRGQLPVSVGSMAANFVHMHVNRLMRNSQRAHEFVISDFLGRVYRSQMGLLSAGLSSIIK